ncbi:MAG: hypothetical protein K8W52_42800, partial [Deltaproteobacteria bacterium]|nr:hypothetical protein [Deltaproteobacteria bacterium]
ALAELRSELEAAKEQATRAEDRVAARDADLAELKQRSEAAIADRETLTGELRSARASAEEAEDLRDRVTELERELARAASGAGESAAASAQLAEVEVERDRLRTRLEDAIAQAQELRDAAASVEDERKRLRQAEDQVIELQDRIATLEREAQRAPAGAAASAPPIGEHVQTLQDSLQSLRTSMRAASDETAVMDQTESVQVVAQALSQAAEEIERAREALGVLSSIAG